jgi:hypothetical protein
LEHFWGRYDDVLCTMPLSPEGLEAEWGRDVVVP